MSTASHNFLSLQSVADLGFLIAPGQEPVYLDMESALRDSLKPASGLETLLFQHVLRGQWNLHRCHRAEFHLSRAQSDPSLDPLLDDANEKPYRRIRQLERASRAALYKALNKLAEIQSEVRYRLQAFPPSEGASIAGQLPHRLSVLCKTGKVLAGALKTGKTAVKKTGAVVRPAQEPLFQTSHPTGRTIRRKPIETTCGNRLHGTELNRIGHF